MCNVVSRTPPVIPVNADRITTYVTITADLLLVEMTETYPGISCEIQHVNILPYLVLPLITNQYLASSLRRNLSVGHQLLSLSSGGFFVKCGAMHFGHTFPIFDFSDATFQA